MENLSVGAFLVALSGMVIVFIMLAILCIMIPVISKIVISLQKPDVRHRVVETTKPQAKTNDKPKTPAVKENVVLQNVDERTAACIMAIVSHETGIPLTELSFKSIKAVG